MDFTGTLSNIFGSSAQQTYSDDNTAETSEISSENESKNLSDPTEISNLENSLESTQINPPQHSEESAFFSILFERLKGGLKAFPKCLPKTINKN